MAVFTCEKRETRSWKDSPRETLENRKEKLNIVIVPSSNFPIFSQNPNARAYKNFTTKIKKSKTVDKIVVIRVLRTDVQFRDTSEISNS